MTKKFTPAAGEAACWWWIRPGLAAALAVTLPVAAAPPPAAGSAPAGATEWNGPRLEQRRLPSAEENAARASRLREFRRISGTVTIVVYPVGVDGALDSGCAGGIARGLCEAGIGRAVTVAPPLSLAMPAREADGPKALWSLAREFSHHLAAQPAGSDYALFVDVALQPRKGDQGRVRLVLCDAQGGWVIVELQDLFQPEFRTAPPASPTEAAAFVVDRIQAWLNPASAAANPRPS